MPQAAAEADSFSPPRPPSHSQNAGTPSTLSTSPGEGGDWSTARQASQGAGDDVPGLKRARTGGALQPPPPPPPPRFSLPQGEGSHQPPRASGTGAGAVPGGVKGGQFHARRGSRGAEGSSYPSSNQAPGKSGIPDPWMAVSLSLPSVCNCYLVSSIAFDEAVIPLTCWKGDAHAAGCRKLSLWLL